jgi:hypothetical protein
MKSDQLGVWKELWVLLVISAGAAIVLPVAIAAHNWTIAVLVGLSVVPVLAGIALGAKAILRGQPPKEPAGTVVLRRLSSKAQRGVALIAIVLAVAVWATLTGKGWGAVVVVPALVVPLLVRLLVVVRREGWSGNKTGRD